LKVAKNPKPPKSSSSLNLNAGIYIRSSQNSAYRQRIDPAGWDYRKYLENPVIQWAHRHDIPAIGKAQALYTDEKGLHGSIVFNDREYDPFGWAIGERVKNGVYRP
jgi:hypothetical protein